MTLGESSRSFLQRLVNLKRWFETVVAVSHVDCNVALGGLSYSPVGVAIGARSGFITVMLHNPPPATAGWPHACACPPFRPAHHPGFRLDFLPSIDSSFGRPVSHFLLPENLRWMN